MTDFSISMKFSESQISVDISFFRRILNGSLCAKSNSKQTTMRCNLNGVKGLRLQTFQTIFLFKYKKTILQNSVPVLPAKNMKRKYLVENEGNSFQSSVTPIYNKATKFFYKKDFFEVCNASHLYRWTHCARFTAIYEDHQYPPCNIFSLKCFTFQLYI